MQRGAGHLPLLRKQVLLLARHHPDQEHVRPPGQPDLEGGQPSQQGLQVPGVQEEEPGGHYTVSPGGDGTRTLQ